MKESTREKAVKFIGHFLSWYQDSFGMPEVVNRIKLEELVKEAEQIHVDRIREIDQEYKKNVITNYNDKPTKILKKQVKRLVSRYSKRT
jgi:hypothetical protein